MRRNRIHLKERRLPTVKDQKAIRLQGKEVPKVPVIQESVNRPSIVNVSLVKSEDNSVTNKESDKMEGKIPRLVPRGEQKDK